ncbi:hypothetical protein CC80DRAFT_445364 [Byssothecium circinans]|uniref:Uncharacterized protein n=1 Tax=Byssothecium circinans TaxID=147558 RepID=A0A6A5TYC7_9PLEO|nr:hypothetical protein CC80DRAFT_445364 [Byssothecium circinans]
MSILLAMAVTPGILGTQEAIRQSQSKEKREEHRARRCNFIAHCIKLSPCAREINNRPFILRDGRIFIDSGTQEWEDDPSVLCIACGYYLPYPDSSHEGMVTRISADLPIMNWIFVDATTYQLRYGVRKDAEGNFTGPFDCTSVGRRVTFQGWEGWCAVEERPGVWGVYFDINDDALRGRVEMGKRILELEVERREERVRKVGGTAVKEKTEEEKAKENNEKASATIPQVGSPLPPAPATSPPSIPLPKPPQSEPTASQALAPVQQTTANTYHHTGPSQTAVPPVTAQSSSAELRSHPLVQPPTTVPCRRLPPSAITQRQVGSTYSPPTPYQRSLPQPPSSRSSHKPISPAPLAAPPSYQTATSPPQTQIEPLRSQTSSLRRKSRPSHNSVGTAPTYPCDEKCAYHSSLSTLTEHSRDSLTSSQTPTSSTRALKSASSRHTFLSARSRRKPHAFSLSDDQQRLVDDFKAYTETMSPVDLALDLSYGENTPSKKTPRKSVVSAVARTVPRVGVGCLDAMGLGSKGGKTKAGTAKKKKNKVGLKRKGSRKAMKHDWKDVDKVRSFE